MCRLCVFVHKQWPIAARRLQTFHITWLSIWTRNRQTHAAAIRESISRRTRARVTVVSGTAAAAVAAAASVIIFDIIREYRAHKTHRIYMVVYVSGILSSNGGGSMSIRSREWPERGRERQRVEIGKWCYHPPPFDVCSRLCGKGRREGEGNRQGSRG